jgi:hypothetical protein
LSKVTISDLEGNRNVNSDHTVLVVVISHNPTVVENERPIQIIHEEWQRTPEAIPNEDWQLRENSISDGA